jgi:hypothetical protein
MNSCAYFCYTESECERVKWRENIDYYASAVFALKRLTIPLQASNNSSSSISFSLYTIFCISLCFMLYFASFAMGGYERCHLL